MRYATLFGALVALFSSPSWGAEAPCAMTYAQFEFAVPHLDLESCPKDLAEANRFCRVSAAGDMVHVFAFAEDGDQCLAAMRSYDEGAFVLAIR